MRFGYALPTWALAGLAVAAIVVSVAAYDRVRSALGPGRHAVLTALRTVTLLLLIAFLLRPVVPVVSDETEAVVAIVIDSSRSMALAGGRSGSRLAEAIELASSRLEPALSQTFRVMWFAGDRSIASADLPQLSATGARTDLGRTLRTIDRRFPEGSLAGMVLISDGAETAHREDAPPQPGGAPIVTIGVGQPAAFDREIRSVTAGPSIMDGSLIDLTVTAVVHGDPSRRVRLRLLQHERVIDLREITAAADGAPVQHVFTVAPEGRAASIYRVEIEGDSAELTLDNNRMDVLVSPPGRRRRILMLEGAPGHEHTFVKRAWLQDSSLEVDSVVRKGTNDRGEPTYYVQAAGARSAALADGFPATLEALLQYDGVVLANLDLETLSRAQLEWLADFVGERGGGLLAFGARTLATAGLSGSTLERVVPVDLGDRRGDPARVSADADVDRLKVGLTDEGGRHPVMRLAQNEQESMKRWASLPPLAAVEAVGAPRPGAAVLAWTSSSAGRVLPLLAVQRYGRGRAMVFAGEASWRWKMLQPISDRSYDTFWRQAIRWLSVRSPDPLSVTAPSGVALGEVVPMAVHVRDAAFRPASSPTVEAIVTAPDGTTTPAAVIPEDPREGRYVTVLSASQPGIYRVTITARQGRESLGAVDHQILAGGADPELADPRLNETVLRRIAESAGGRYVGAEDAAEAAEWLRETARARREELRDAWHGAWSFVCVVALLSVEWTLRRRWGLR